MKKHLQAQLHRINGYRATIGTALMVGAGSVLAAVPESVTTELTAASTDTKTVAGIVEGGLSTEAYAARFLSDPDSAADIVDLAMSIEAQALDLYTRAAWKCADERSKGAFLHIADEEKAHLRQLGRLMDRLV